MASYSIVLWWCCWVCAGQCVLHLWWCKHLTWESLRLLIFLTYLYMPPYAYGGNIARHCTALH